MKYSRWITVLTICLILACCFIGCGKEKDPSQALLGTWYYVDSNNELTGIWVSFDEEGIIRIGVKEGIAPATQEMMEQLVNTLFGEISDTLQSVGICFNVSVNDVAETFEKLLIIKYRVLDSEELELTVEALKIITINHVIQYHFKSNGDLVLGGIVIRKG